MNDTSNASFKLDERGRAYPIDTNTRLLMWFCAAAGLAFALGFAGFGLLFASSKSDRFLASIGATAFVLFALFALRISQRLATILYPDRVVSRGVFVDASLSRRDIEGYELIPGRNASPRLKLTPKDPAHKCLYVYQFSPDDTFREWFSTVPDLRLTPKVIHRKRRINKIVATLFVLGWCTLLVLGLRQNIQQYNHFMLLKSRGVAAEGYVKSKSVSGRSHTPYLSYVYNTSTDSRHHAINAEIEIDTGDYQSVSVGDPIPVVYDPVDNTISYPNLNGLLSRINPRIFIRHSIIFWGLMTLFMIVLMGGAYIADARAARKPLP